MEPSPMALNGRDPATGRFTAGHTFAKGNPHARKVARLRSALLKSVTVKDVRAVIKALLDKARSGDVAAIRELLSRLLGPPIEVDLISRLDELEQLLQKRDGQDE